MTEIFNESFNTSIISEIEFLGWHKFSEKSLKNAAGYLGRSSVNHQPVGPITNNYTCLKTFMPCTAIQI